MMNPHLDGLADIGDRLLKLEKQNRRFKQLGVTTLIVATSLAVMGQVPSKKTIEANEFVLRDDDGNIRARLFVTAKSSTKLTLPGVAESVPVTLNLTPTLALYDEKGQTRAILDGGSVSFFNSKGNVDGTLGGGTLMVAGEGNSGAVLAGGFASVFDEEGFSAVLGVQSLETQRTGVTHVTHKASAASLVLFDKNKKMIWQAP